MTVVIDSSMALAWAYHDEATPVTLELLNSVAESGGWVPAIWRLEVANSLQHSVRRGRIDIDFRDRALAQLGSLDLAIDTETNDHAWRRTLDLADQFRLTTYGACYLELAERRNLPLATLDRELRAAAAKWGLSLAG